MQNAREGLVAGVDVEEEFEELVEEQVPSENLLVVLYIVILAE